MARRLILVAIGVVFAIVVATAAAAYWFLSGDAVRVALENQATRWVGQRVTIGTASARLFPRPGITLGDVRVGDPVRIMLADVQVSTGLEPLWSRRIEDAEVAVSDSRIDMPLPFALPASGAGAARPPSTRPPSTTAVQIVSIRSIKLRNITVASRGREIKVSADSSLSSAHLNLDGFTAVSGTTSLEASGLVALSPRLDAQLQVKAGHVDIDDLIALADAFAPRSTNRAPASSGALPGRLVARISAETARTSGVDLRQFATTLVAQGNRITLSPASFQLFGGTYRGTIDIDSQVGALRATVRAQIADIDVAQLASFGGAPDTVSGRLSGTGTFNGRGVTLADAIAAATGEGKVTIAKGALKRLGLVRTVVLFFGRSASDAGASNDAFERIDATFALIHQVVAASAVSLHSTDVDLVGQGSLTIPSKALDGHMDLSLSEALSAQAGTDLARFTREDNRVLLPAVIGGTLGAPRLTIDAGAAIRRGLRNEVQRRLKDILGTLAPAPPD
jgi:uncharacterized protein involved in outer membrane biogenesis